ncbi:MAG: type II secretion system F family protein [Chloroflexi bacterium]|nr:type II secretion system F family protein [Chloroflexota bacterium]
MDVLLVIIAMTVLLAVFSFVVGLRSSRRSAMEERLDTFRSERQRGEGETQRDEQQGPVLRQRSYSGLPILSSFIGQLRGSEQVALKLERAGVPLRVGEYYIIRYVAALVFFAVPFIFSQGVLAIAMGLGLAVLGYSLPAIWLGSKRSGRAKKIDGQMVEMLGMVANSLKSGYGLMQSFEFTANQIDAPLGTELKRMLRDANLGMSAEDALQAMGDRIDSLDLEMVLTAVNIQRSVGGNLAEVLESVAFTMRERERIRGEIATLTSQQRMTGIVIGGLPVGMLLIFLLISPDYVGLLFTTTAGQGMLLVAVVLEVLGALSMKKLLAIDV